MEGVVRMPSAFSMTFGVLPSITATHELVVPRSIPMTLPMSGFLLSAAGRPGPFGTRTRESATPAAPPHSDPLNTHRCRRQRRLGSYRRAGLGRKTYERGFRACKAAGAQTTKSNGRPQPFDNKRGQATMIR